MWLRFSLRVMLVAFGVMAAALYVFVVRPTMLAQKFVAAVSGHDYGTARGLIGGAADWNSVVHSEGPYGADRIYAELMPREWQDVWRRQRRIILRVSRHNDRGGGYVDWTEDTDVVARPRGLRAEKGTGTFCSEDCAK